jgi:predicted metalloprotease with PDZ domain
MDTNTQLNISYTLSFPQAQTHYMEVVMEIRNITQPYINLKMPVWTPGSYLVREYAKNLEGLTAWQGDAIVPFKKTSKNTWHIPLNGAGKVKVKYSLYCFEVSVRTNFVNTAHAFVSPAATFLFPEGMLNNPSTIHIKPYNGWDKVSTGLEPVADEPFTLHTPDYDTLYDSPVEVGNQHVWDFDVAGVKYEVAMCMGGNYDQDKLTADLSNMVEKETAIFGENPNKRYVFIVHNYAKGGGGLEHLNSTVLGATRDGYTNADTYQRFLSLAAHEHFHLWNVKRLRPIALGPFDYENENYTTDLWIAEGFTNYYDNLIVHRMGLYPPENYLTILCADINLVENTPGIRVQPLYDASFDAWIKFYRPNENSVNTTISYYSKGGLLALLLDLEIINNSEGKYSLNDVMRCTYTEFYKKQNRGYNSEEFKAALEQYTGKNLDAFYENNLYGTTPINYNTYLNYAGMALVDDLAASTDPSLGISVSTTSGKPIITSVLRDSAAWIDGLNVHDEITAINGEPYTDLGAATANKHVGEQLTVSVIRDGMPLHLKLTLLKNTKVNYRLASISSPSARQILIRNCWLKQG